MVKKVRRSDSFLQCNPADSHIIIYFHLRIFYTTIPFHINQQRTFPIAPNIKFCILQKSAAVICKKSKGKNRLNTRLGHCSKHVKKSLYSQFPRTRVSQEDEFIKRLNYTTEYSIDMSIRARSLI